MCHCGNTWVEQTQNKSQHTSLTLEKKTLPPFSVGSIEKQVWQTDMLTVECGDMNFLIWLRSQLMMHCHGSAEWFLMRQGAVEQVLWIFICF